MSQVIWWKYQLCIRLHHLRRWNLSLIKVSIVVSENQLTILLTIDHIYIYDIMHIVSGDEENIPAIPGEEEKEKSDT